ncbi:restriction system protein [Tangfeifania diversioriginum]|uniref:Restriction system protein n=1 Tax=Tangfeifania diversioriginum TaxID=1168035 RepID=A0A1M6IMJ3_9BACT|nr:Mrr restriction system protein [Tangfeifania diversioriginum]SHJ35657.1 restriction system protein [Tangfeifania diversioriginum]
MVKKLPTRNELMDPTIEAIRQLGGSANTDEIYEKIVENLNLSDSLLEIINGKTGQSDLKYNLAWVRTMLKNQGVISNVGKGIWVLKSINSNYNKKSNISKIKETEEEVEDSEKWKRNALKIITEKMSPSAFERLIQRVLRETGFIQVEIKGKSGDGGIDGIGIAKINGILSFHIIFQCKRIKGKVPCSEIRDFRGAMVGRTDKGLFITTGTFTRDAIREANRDGAPSIDLIDGEKLVEKLKELKLGIKTELKEQIDIDEKWFKNF